MPRAFFSELAPDFSRSIDQGVRRVSQDRASRQRPPLYRSPSAYLLMRGFPIPTKLQETQVTIKVKHSVVAGVLAGY